MAGLCQGGGDGTLEKAQSRVHGEKQDQSGTLHDQQKLATRDVHNKAAMQTTTLIFELMLKVATFPTKQKNSYFLLDSLRGFK